MEGTIALCKNQGKPMDRVGGNSNEEFMREGSRRIKRAGRKSLILCFGFKIMKYYIHLCFRV